MDGKLGIGNRSDKVILLSGVRCDQMGKILPSLFTSSSFKQFYSTNKLIGKNDNPVCEVHTNVNLDNLIDDTAAKVNELAKEIPVILFTSVDIRSKIDGDDEFVVPCNDKDDLSMLRAVTSQKSRMVIILAEKYAQGIDFHFFQTTATVVVLHAKKEAIVPYTIKQMFGRGMRDHECTLGHLYALGNKMKGTQYKDQLAKKIERPFDHGDEVLAEFVKESRKQNTKVKQDKAYNWQCSIAEFRTMPE